MVNESPVCEGVFPSGPELMLWRPGVDRRRLRRRAALRSLLSAPGGCVVLGAAGIGIGVGTDIVSVRWSGVVVALSALVVVASLVHLVVDVRWFDVDHYHRNGRACFVESRRGEYFYRPTDFADHPSSIVSTVARVLAEMREIHSSPAAAWLDPTDLQLVHQLVWDTARVVDRTRAVRTLVDAAPEESATDEVVACARARVAMVDSVLDRVVHCVDQVALLVSAWDRKLADNARIAQLRAELVTAEVPTAAIDHATDWLPQSVFSHVTAARDLLGAGAFDWERPGPWRQPSARPVPVDVAVGFGVGRQEGGAV